MHGSKLCYLASSISKMGRFPPGVWSSALDWQHTSLLSRVGGTIIQFWPLMSFFYVMKPGIINFVGPLLWQFDKAQESLLRDNIFNAYYNT